MAFSPETITILSEKLSKTHVSTRQQSGVNLSYIESHHAIREANRAFGFDGWVRETFNLNVVQCEQVDNKWRVSYTAQSRIVVHGVARIGTGFGQGIDKDLGKAHESAIKEAESDAMKRALMTFGDIFGLALYDKQQTNVAPVEQEKAPAPVIEGQAEARAFIESLKLTKEEAKDFNNLLKQRGLKPTPTTLMAKEEGVKDYDELIKFVKSLEVAA